LIFNSTASLSNLNTLSIALSYGRLGFCPQMWRIFTGRKMTRGQGFGMDSVASTPALTPGLEPFLSPVIDVMARPLVPSQENLHG
jgi:hypothetical protein